MLFKQFKYSTFYSTAYNTVYNTQLILTPNSHRTEKTVTDLENRVGLDAHWCAVLQVVAGDGHTACVVEGGGLYTWGYGEYGQLGHGDGEDVLVPRLVLGELAWHVTQ